MTVVPLALFVLTTTPVVGEVVALPKGTTLYSSAGAALGHAPRATFDAARLDLAEVHAITDAGVVEVRHGGPEADCLSRRPEAMDAPEVAVAAYVAAEHLVPRLAEGIVRENADGTGVRLQQGAPVRMTREGLVPADPLLAKAAGPLPTTGLAWSSPRKPAPPPAWRQPFAPLVCDPKPEPAEAWRQRKQAEQSEARKKKHDQAVADRLAACQARERAKPPTRTKKGGVLGDADGPTCEKLSALGAFDEGMSTDLQRPLLFVPLCSLRIERPETAMARLGDAPFALLSELEWSVTGIAAGPIAEVVRPCGTLRVAVPEDRLTDGGGGGGLGLGGLGESRRRLRTGAALTWPDGRPAGKVVRSGVLRASALSPAVGARSCFTRLPYAEPLCVADKDVCDVAASCSASTLSPSKTKSGSRSSSE